MQTTLSTPQETPHPAAASRASKPQRRRLILAIFLLAGLVAVVYGPMLRFEFVDYDVTGQVVENPHIRGLTWANLKYIFTTRCVTSYYPVRTLSFALDYQLWGLNPMGFELTNGLIHLANVLLVFWLALRLVAIGSEAFRESPLTPGPSPARGEGSICPAQPQDGSTAPPGFSPATEERHLGGWDVFLAAVAAGLFAVHPLVVEPVAWVAGREELLMTLGVLGSVHFHIAARRFASAGVRRSRIVACHVAAALCCAAACLSNSVAVVIPLIVTAWDLLTLRPLRLGRIVSGTAALWLIAAVAIPIKILGHVGVVVEGPPLLSAHRAMAILNVYYGNLKALVWPVDLAPARLQYVPESFLDPAVVVGAVALVLTGLLLWSLRRQRLLLFGLLWFLLALLPTSQIVINHIHRADRFLYLPLAGLVLAGAMAVRPFGRFVPQGLVPKAAVGAVGVWSVLFLAILSSAQLQTWRDSITMWDNVVRVEPKNALAHFALGNNLAKAGHYDLAEQHLQTQIWLDFNDAEAMRQASLFAIKGKEGEPPNYELAVQLARRSCELTRWQNRGCLNTLAAAETGLAKSLVEQSQYRRAIEHYRLALKADPDHRPALVQMAVILATTSDIRLREPQEAVRLAERAQQLGSRDDPIGLMVLSTAYAEAWDFDNAIAATEKGIQLAENRGEKQLAEELRHRLLIYQKRIPPESLR